MDGLLLLSVPLAILVGCGIGMSHCSENNQLRQDYCEKKQGTMYNDICMGPDGTEIVWPQYIKVLL